MSEGPKEVRRGGIVANPTVSVGYSDRLVEIVDERGGEVGQLQ